MLIFALLKGRGFHFSVCDAIFDIVNGHNTDQSSDLSVHSKKDAQHLLCRDAHIQHVVSELEELESARETWPQPIPESTVMSCLKSYRESIKFVPLSVCASCGAEDHLKSSSYFPLAELPSLDILQIHNKYILEHTPCSRFTYIHKDLDGLLLEPKGIRAIDDQCEDVELYLCIQCSLPISRKEMPCLALNNNMYRGELPEDLQDITWVKEMACALYRTTAHVARLFGSSSESEPLHI